MYVTEINNNEYIKVQGVNFKNGAKSFQANIASLKGGLIEIRLDSLGGKLISTCKVASAGGQKKWTTVTSKVSMTDRGVHNLFFVFKGDSGELFNFNWWKFNSK